MNEIHFKDNIEILRGLPDKSIDLILEDMPYNTTNLHFEYAVDFVEYWKERTRVIKDNGAIVLFGVQPFFTDLIQSNRKLFRYEIIWQKTQKTNFPNAKKMPLRGHENIGVFYKKLPTYNPQKYYSPTSYRHTRKKTPKQGLEYEGYSGGFSDKYQYTNDNGMVYPDSIIKFSNWNGALFGNADNATIHPTQKPLDLFRWIIRTYTNEGDTVFDGYVGSGTTALACIEEKRQFIVCEWNEEYYIKAKKRIEDETLRKRFTLGL